MIRRSGVNGYERDPSDFWAARPRKKITIWGELLRPFLVDTDSQSVALQRR